jgi:hypothetical protein
MEIGIALDKPLALKSSQVDSIACFILSLENGTKKTSIWMVLGELI